MAGIGMEQPPVDDETRLAEWLTRMMNGIDAQLERLPLMYGGFHMTTPFLNFPVSATPTLLNIWDANNPSAVGPYNVAAVVGTGQLKALQTGVFVMNFYATIDHKGNDNFEIMAYINDVPVNRFVRVDSTASQGNQNISFNLMGYVAKDQILDLRISTLQGTPSPIDFISSDWFMFGVSPSQ